MFLSSLVFFSFLFTFTPASAQYSFPFLFPSPIRANPPLSATQPQPTAPRPYTNPISVKVSSVQYGTTMQFLNASGAPWNVYCDLGFTGVVGGKVIWTFGDTSIKSDTGTYQFNAVDSTGIGFLTYPSVVYENNADPTGTYINSLVPLNPAELATGGYTKWSFGGTNILEPRPGSGLGTFYYLKISRTSSNPLTAVSGAGVAQVRLGGGLPARPSVTRLGETLWGADEPQWGDVGQVLDSTTGFVYVFGHGPLNSPNNAHLSTYLARVPRDAQGDVSKYQYWLNDSQTWTSERLTAAGRAGTRQITTGQAVFGYLAMGQATPFWNNYFKRWMFVYGDYTGFSNVLLKMSSGGPEGPWVDYGVIAKTNSPGANYKYAITGHPEYDNSGKSVFVTWAENNKIYTCTVNFG